MMVYNICNHIKEVFILDTHLLVAEAHLLIADAHFLVTDAHLLNVDARHLCYLLNFCNLK